MVGILPFLMQWLALSKHTQQHSSHKLNNQQYYTPKSHWTLINEFADLPEDEIELFLPQVCNIIIDNDAPDEFGIFQQLERTIINKCANCLPFGLKVSHLLKVFLSISLLTHIL
jgi:hypothetical protein